MKEVFNLNLTFVIPKFQFFGRQRESGKSSLRKIINASNTDDRENTECAIDVVEIMENEECLEDEESVDSEPSLESEELEEE